MYYFSLGVLLTVLTGSCVELFEARLWNNKRVSHVSKTRQKNEVAVWPEFRWRDTTTWSPFFQMCELEFQMKIAVKDDPVPIEGLRGNAFLSLPIGADRSVTRETGPVDLAGSCSSFSWNASLPSAAFQGLVFERSGLSWSKPTSAKCEWSFPSFRVFFRYSRTSSDREPQRRHLTIRQKEPWSVGLFVLLQLWCWMIIRLYYRTKKKNRFLLKLKLISRRSALRRSLSPLSHR